MSPNVTRITAGRPWPGAEDGPLTAARKLIARGLMITPVQYRHKEPPRGWKSKRIDEATAEKHFDDDMPSNIGVMMGRRSGCLVDVNLQCAEAIALAPRGLPSTLTFGRASRARSHLLFYADNAHSAQWLDPDTATPLVEIRADTPTGDPSHTIFPPSAHEETGERITFDAGPQEPHQTDAATLHTLCSELAAACILKRRWKDLRKTDVIGALARAQWDAPRILRLLQSIDETTTPEEVSDVVVSHVEGKQIPGWHAVEKSIGGKHARAVESWLNARAVAARGNFTVRPVHEMVPDAPAYGLMCPHGYALGVDETVTMQPFLTASGEETLRDSVIAAAPILITGRVIGEVENVRLTWRTDEEWRSVICPRRTAMDASHLMDLSNKRFPVGSDNAKHVAKYLRHFEAANITQIPTARVTRQLGWQGDRRFLWGTTLLDGGSRSNADLAELDPSRWPQDALSFQPLSDGDGHFASAFRTRGSVDGWRAAIDQAAVYPLVMAGIYAAFIPVVMQVLGIHNFILSWSCTTSHGKTSAMRAAASVWGDPDDQSPDGSVIGRWNATRVGIEARCAMSNGLPLFVDDTKQVKRKDYVESVIYDVSAAQTGTRGEKSGGTRVVQSFRTVLFTTGESALHTFAAEGSGGARARTVELSDPPWGEATERTLPIVDSVNAGVISNHGFAGPAFVEWWLGQRDKWPEHRAAHEATRARYASLAKTGEEARLLDYVAAIDTAAHLARMAQVASWNAAPTLAALTEAVRSEARVVRPETRALDWLWSWTVAHEQEFLGRNRTTPETLYSGGDDIQPPSGWAGTWDDGKEWEHVDYLPARLEQLLKDAGFDPRETMRAWVRAGYVQHESGRLTITARVSNARTKVYRIRRLALSPVDVPGLAPPLSPVES